MYDLPQPISAAWRRYAVAALVSVVVVGAGVLGYRVVRGELAEAQKRASAAELRASEAVARADDLRRSMDEAVAAARAANDARAATQKRLAEASASLDAMAHRVTGLDGAFRVLHDAAANGCGAPADGAAGGRDATPVDPQALAATIADNYCRAEANRQQVIRLQKLLGDLAGLPRSE